MRKILSFVILLSCISFFDASSNHCLKANTLITTTIPQSRILNVIKLAACELNCSSDWLYAEYQSGNCTITLIDPKRNAFLVEAGGFGTLIIESTI